MKQRTADEIKAYVDGYNACYERFCECLKDRKSVPDSIRKMSVFVNIVNDITTRFDKGEQE